MSDRFAGTSLSRAHISEDLNLLLTELDNSDSGKTGGDILEALISDAANETLAMLTRATSGAGAKIELAEATANGTSKVTFQAPASLATDRTITIPDAAVDLGAIATNSGKVSCTTANVKEALHTASTELGIGLDEGDYPDEKNNLVVGATSGNNGVSIVSSTTGVSSLAFRNSTGNNDGEGIIDYSGNTKTMRFMTNGFNTALTLDTNQNATVAGKISVANGIDITTKTGITVASASASATVTCTQNLRAGSITVDMGHNWANNSSFHIPLSNTEIDADSVVVVSCSRQDTTWEVMALANNSCAISAFNSTGGNISDDFIVNYVVL